MLVLESKSGRLKALNGMLPYKRTKYRTYVMSYDWKYKFSGSFSQKTPKTVVLDG